MVSMSPSLPPSEQPDETRAAAVYIAAMTGELEKIARHHGLATLGYLLTIAQLEAETATLESAPQP
jgi:hypothetical protein